MEEAKCPQSGLPQRFHLQRLACGCFTHSQHTDGFTLTTEGSLCAISLTHPEVDLDEGPSRRYSIKGGGRVLVKQGMRRKKEAGDPGNMSVDIKLTHWFPYCLLEITTQNIF